ncbi:MAG TPA: ketoacyl-ACP synthase III [Blastocatellia bacterium]|nr:ketoacyl-ACP synthase III [Blastocatellia bacterium]
MECYITGYGSALPDRRVTNAELAPLLSITPEQIEAGSGIRERRWVLPDQSASDLAVEAVECALQSAGCGPEKIDYLIGCTLSPDYQVPGIAPIVQRKLGRCPPVPAVDLRVGCAAILYSLQLARGMIESGSVRRIVCFGSEAQSKGLDLNPRSAELSMLFGDGAGAVVMCREPNSSGTVIRIEDVLIATDGSFAEELGVRGPGTANGPRWLDPDGAESDLYRPSMNGRSVILHAVRKLADAATQITARNGVTMNQVDLVIPHQANLNLLRSLATRLSIPVARIITNVQRYGNTSGASAFIALCEAEREGQLRSGHRVLIMAFGAGFTWGAALCQVC